MTNPVIASNATPAYAANSNAETALSLETRESSITCLIGPSLSGPKACLRMLAGLDAPDSGEILVLGMNTRELDSSAWKYLRTHTAYVTGDTPLLSIQSGLANVMLPALYHGLGSVEEVESRARALLEMLGCNSDADDLPAYMSPLERCLAGIARALIINPKVLFLEYPFHELDTKERKALTFALAKVREETDLCIIAAVRDLGFAKEFADQFVYTSRAVISPFKNRDDMLNTASSEIQQFLKDEFSKEF